MTMGYERQNGTRAKTSVIYSVGAAIVALTCIPGHAYPFQDTSGTLNVVQNCVSPQVDDAFETCHPSNKYLPLPGRTDSAADEVTIAYAAVGDLLEQHAEAGKIEDADLAKESFLKNLKTIVFTEPKWYEKNENGDYVEYETESDSNRLVWADDLLVLRGTDDHHRALEVALNGWHLHGFDDRFQIDCRIVATNREVAEKIGAVKFDDRTGKITTAVKRVSEVEIEPIGTTLAASESTKILFAPRVVTAMKLTAEINVGELEYVSMPQTCAPTKTLYRPQWTGTSLRTRIEPNSRNQKWNIELVYSHSIQNPVQPASFTVDQQNALATNASNLCLQQVCTGFSLDKQILGIVGIEAPAGSDHEYEILMISYRKIDDGMSENTETPVGRISNIINSATVKTEQAIDAENE